MSPQLFAILSSLVEERLGLHYDATDIGIFSDRITTRATEAGFDTPLDYYYFLRYDPAAALELEALADALVVGETYFFRELEALRAGVEHVLVPAVERSGRARVWSAACATGEEPLSVAMLLDEAGIRHRCEIMATDLSPRALRRAGEAQYSARSLRALPPHPPPPGWTPRLASIADRSFARAGSGASVERSVVDSIEYRRLNLLDKEAISALGTFDLVLCRNVLIYFADATVMSVVGSLVDATAEHGRLLVGASESLLRFGTVLRCEERGGAFFYTRDTK